ncbi:MAG: alpha/beta fold hydrolase [Spirochaetes bacterium]|nr:MAG: alpha/beta fold hydrolase [Spirochaetota bacterium]
MAFHQLIDEPQMNFSVNRILTYGENAADINEVRDICEKIHDFDTWYNEWIILAAKAEREKRYFHAAFYYRMAEFFLTDDKEEKLSSYVKCKENFSRAIGRDHSVAFKDVPFMGGSIPAMILSPNGISRAIILIHGGYDSYMEEFYLTAKRMVELGYTVIMFEGPGQGAALKNGFKFTYKWEEPVSAVLDFFDMEAVTLIGISWGGYLAQRAAAFDARIKRVVSYDVFYNGMDFITNAMPKGGKLFLKAMFRLGAKTAVNRLVRWARKKKPLADWGISHGMYITGTDTPYDFFKALSKHDFGAIGGRVTQDVLLLAGERDHLVPAGTLQKMKKKLRNAKSITTRVFTAEEGGEQHCQVGNIELAVNEIHNWMNSFSLEHAAMPGLPVDHRRSS